MTMQIIHNNGEVNSQYLPRYNGKSSSFLNHHRKSKYSKLPYRKFSPKTQQKYKNMLLKKHSSKKLPSSNTNLPHIDTEKEVLRQIRDLLQNINEKIPSNLNKIKNTKMKHTHFKTKLLNSKTHESQFKNEILPQRAQISKKNNNSQNLNINPQESLLDNKPSLFDNALFEMGNVLSVLSDNKIDLLNKRNSVGKNKERSTSSSVTQMNQADLNAGENELNMLEQNTETKLAMEALANALINNATSSAKASSKALSSTVCSYEDIRNIIQSAAFGDDFVPKKETISELSKKVASEDYVSIEGFKNWNNNRKVSNEKPKYSLPSKAKKSSKRKDRHQSSFDFKPKKSRNKVSEKTPEPIISSNKQDSSGVESLEDKLTKATYSLR
ncbi:hypothetical protein TNCV_2235971 [Trichonephila clavipes]|nr:hypothetical protein TNCV_2235971 [Trichonephila clavipes]